MINSEDIKDFFNNLHLKKDFNTKYELTWGFFFLSSDVGLLYKLRDFCVTMGYKYVDLFEAEKDNEGDLDEFYLHLEKMEKHTIDTLNQRNEEFYKIAEKFKVEYDGFDVGHV